MELYREDAPPPKLRPPLHAAFVGGERGKADTGIDIVNDGEFGKAMRRSVDYGAWWSYIYDRIARFEIRQAQAEKGRTAWTFGSQERKEFAEFYREDGGMGGAGQTAGSSA